MLPSEIHNDLECRRDSADRTRLTSPRARNTSATCPAGSSAYRMTLKAVPHTDLHCKQENSTSAATKPRATSARQKSSWPSSLRCMPSITAQKDYAQSPSEFIG